MVGQIFMYCEVPNWKTYKKYDFKGLLKKGYNLNQWDI